MRQLLGRSGPATPGETVWCVLDEAHPPLNDRSQSCRLRQSCGSYPGYERTRVRGIAGQVQGPSLLREGQSPVETPRFATTISQTLSVMSFTTSSTARLLTLPENHIDRPTSA